MDRGAWWVTVHRVTQSQTRLKQFSMHAHTAQEDMGIKLCVAVGAGQPDALLCPLLLWAMQSRDSQTPGKVRQPLGELVKVWLWAEFLQVLSG